MEIAKKIHVLRLCGAATKRAHHHHRCVSSGPDGYKHNSLEASIKASANPENSMQIATQSMQRHALEILFCCGRGINPESPFFPSICKRFD